jgi:hypothetical protein
MRARTWDYIFKALTYAGCFAIVIYYFKPALFASLDPNHPSPIVPLVGIYILLWVLVYMLWYFFSGEEAATVTGLWAVAPPNRGAEYYKGGKMEPAKATVDLLNEAQTFNNLSESFTFSFFVSVDNGGIDTVRGESLRSGSRPYQNLIIVPGAYNVAIDPLHETMRIKFVTHDANPYEVLIPTVSIRRWHQILITIEGRTADIYQNGILLKSVALPNVISGRPGKPQIYMNSEMYARVAYVQAWPRRILEKEVNDNYRMNVSDQNVPPLPSTSTEFFGIPKFNFCLGGLCIDSSKSKSSGLTYVEYNYA